MKLVIASPVYSVWLCADYDTLPLDVIWAVLSSEFKQSEVWA